MITDPFSPSIPDPADPAACVAPAPVLTVWRMLHERKRALRNLLRILNLGGNRIIRRAFVNLR